MAVTISGLPSPFKSCTASPRILFPAGKSTRAAKELVVMLPGELMFLKMETTLLSALSAMMSCLPSPSRSTTVSVYGLDPLLGSSGRSTRGAKEPAVSEPFVLMF